MPRSLYDVTALRAADLDRCYALLRMAHPRLTIERWRDHAMAALAPDQPRGAIVARREPYIYGLALYATIEPLSGRPVLRVEDLIALDMVNARWIYERLLAALEQIARRLGCVRLEYAVDDENAADEPLGSLAHSGLAPDGRRYAKPLAEADILPFVAHG